MTSSPAPQTSPANAPPPAKANPVRMMVLLGVLAVVVVMLLVDLLVFKPAEEQARQRLTEATEARMRMGFGAEGEPKKKHNLDEKEVIEVVGRQPSWQKEQDNQVIQTFAWWGSIPIQRHRFDVRFKKSADGTLTYDSHDGYLEFDKTPEVDVRIIDAPLRDDPSNTESGGETTTPTPPGPGTEDGTSSPPDAGAPSDTPAAEPDAAGSEDKTAE